MESFKRFLFNVEVVIEEWVGREGNDMKTPRVKMVFKAVAKAKDETIKDDDLPF